MAITLSPANLPITAVAGDPLTVILTTVFSDGNPLSASVASNPIIAVVNAYYEIQPTLLPTVVATSASVFSISWTAAQTQGIANSGNGSWGFSLDINGNGPYAIVAGKLIMIPSTFAGITTSTNSTIDVNIGTVEAIVSVAVGNSGITSINGLLGSVTIASSTLTITTPSSSLIDIEIPPNTYDAFGAAAAAQAASEAYTRSIVQSASVASNAYAYGITNAASIAAISTSEAYALAQASAASVGAILASNNYSYSITNAASIGAISTSESYARSQAVGASIAATAASDPYGYAAAASVATVGLIGQAVNRFGADPSGVNSSDSAFAQAYAALGGDTGQGNIVLGIGTYKLTTFVNKSPDIGIVGPGSAACTIVSYATGDTLRVYNPNFNHTSAFSQTFFAGKISGFTIDGTNAGTSASGLHYGDLMNGRFDDIVIQNFTGSSAVGLWMDNIVGWCERMTWVGVQVLNCTTCIKFDVNSGASSGTGFASFAYSDYGTIKLAPLANQDGIVISNGCLVVSVMTVVGNFGQSLSGGNTGVALRITGSSNNAGGLTYSSYSGVFNFLGETDWDGGLGSTPHQTINIDSNFLNRFEVTGFMDFVNTWTPSNCVLGGSAATFLFAGFSYGDANISDGGSFSNFSVFGASSRGPGIAINGELFTSTGDSFNLGVLSGNLTVSFSAIPSQPRELWVRAKQAASGGPFTLTWPTIAWSTGSTPVMTATANAVNWYILRTVGDGTWEGEALQNTQLFDTLGAAAAAQTNAETYAYGITSTASVAAITASETYAYGITSAASIASITISETYAASVANIAQAASDPIGSAASVLASVAAIYAPLSSPALVNTPTAPTGPAIAGLTTIAFDHAAQKASTNSVSSITWSHTTAGTNRYLLVWAYVFTTPLTTPPIATYGGTPMTLLGQSAAGLFTWYCWGLIAPAVGANNVIVTANVSTVQMGANSVSYTGTNQAYQALQVSTQQLTVASTSFAPSITLTSTNCWVAGGFVPNAGTVSASTGLTIRGSVNSSRIVVGDNNGAVSAGASVSEAASSTSSALWAAVLVPVYPLSSTQLANAQYVDAAVLVETTRAETSTAFVFNVTSPTLGVSGAAGNAVHLVGNSTISASTTAYTNSGASFTPADVGKIIYVMGAGSSSDRPLVTTIASYLSSASVTLTAAATTSVSNTDTYYGTDDTAAIQAAINAAAALGGGRVTGPPRNYLIQIGVNSITPPGFHAENYALKMASGVYLDLLGMTLMCPWNPAVATSCCIIADPNLSYLTPASNWGVINGSIDGGGSVVQEDEQYGVLVTTSTDVWVQHCEIFNTRSKATMCLSATTGQESYRVHFVDNTIHNVAGNFIGMTGAYELDISRNRMFNGVSMAESILSSGDLFRCTITDNMIDMSTPTTAFPSTNAQISIAGTEIIVSGNTIKNGASGGVGTGLATIQLTSGTALNIIITNNLIDNSLVTTTNFGCIGMGGTGAAGNGGFIVTGNICLPSTGSGFGAISIAQSNMLSSVTVTNNNCNGGPVNISATGSTIANNFVGTALTVGGSDASIAGNVITSSIANTPFSTTASTFTATGNTIINTAVSETIYLVEILGATDWIFSNNYCTQSASVSSGTPSIDIVSSSGGIFSNNVCTFGGGNFGVTENGSSNNLYIGNSIVGVSQPFRSIASSSVTRDNPGYNPVSGVSVAVPLSTAAVAAVNYDRTFTVTAGSGGVVIVVGSSTVATIPGNGVCPVFVPAGATMTPTYTNAPTWTCYGN